MSQNKLNPIVHAFNQLFIQHIHYNDADSRMVQKHVDTFIHELHTLSYTKENLPWLHRERHLVTSSFGRGTHINPLKHVQLLICLNGDDSRIKTTGTSDSYIIRINDGAGRFGDMINAKRELNSSAIAHNFAHELQNFPEAKNVSISSEGGATYRRQGCLWVFNVIPSFFIKHPKTGTTFYLVPDQHGHWRPIYPHTETATLQAINQQHNGLLYDLIYIMKYWNREHDISTIPSSLLEAIVVNYCEAKSVKLKEFIDLDISGLLRATREAIIKPLVDPLGSRGDLNILPSEARKKIAEQAFSDQLKAESARNFELARDYKRSMEKWAQVIGHEFTKLAQIN